MDNFFLWACAGTIAGLVAFYHGFTQLKKKRLMENIPTSKIRSMALGLVEVEGDAEPVALLTAPFSKAACVYYQYKVEELRQSRNSRTWVMIHHGNSQDAPFYLHDDTGQVLVNPRGSEVN